ncbi:hypothetical protein NDU88_006427 [Pleurodeles waltl]|uniref:Uncharacterized protein n=1 Tax=Pleurodeles waltl TaxID=8319 RepID=A0AAV7UNY7_PLEWA|nr:hypothetical protein NDU88_006427 [Pleurodeles waltl]
MSIAWLCIFPHRVRARPPVVAPRFPPVLSHCKPTPGTVRQGRQPIPQPPVQADAHGGRRPATTGFVVPGVSRAGSLTGPPRLRKALGQGPRFGLQTFLSTAEAPTTPPATAGHLPVIVRRAGRIGRSPDATPHLRMPEAGPAALPDALWSARPSQPSPRCFTAPLRA